MVVDLDELRQVPLRWEPDPDRLPMLEAVHRGRRIRMRLNVEFPDVPMFTLHLGEDEYEDFDELPEPWELGELGWPNGAERVPYHIPLEWM